ncbi:MAG: hypothetical protein K5840_03425 [Eubacterium sp.]|nr:hypothetical protein [Eubacterium sp.]
MTEAVVYISNTGFTRQYADLLSKKLSLKEYSFEEAKKALPKGSRVIFLSWIRKGRVEGYKKAAARFGLDCVVGVGMSIEGMEVAEGFRSQTKMGDEPFFYVQGGFDFSRLTGMNRFIMKQFRDVMVPRMEGRTDLDEAQMNMLKMFRDGGNAVSIDRLSPVVEWYRNREE